MPRSFFRGLQVLALAVLVVSVFLIGKVSVERSTQGTRRFLQGGKQREEGGGRRSSGDETEPAPGPSPGPTPEEESENGSQDEDINDKSSMFPLTAIRSIDGRETQGRAGATLMRVSFADYPNGKMKGENMPNPRAVSNSCSADDGPSRGGSRLSDMAWQWGQFLDHDIDLTEANGSTENIPTADDDPLAPFIPFERSRASGGEQVNSITACIDGSAVYGSDETRASALRSFEGGKLKMSEGNLLAFNTGGLENAGGGGSVFFIAGDVRANEQLGLAAMHTLWAREHNRLCDAIAEKYDDASEEDIYQLARKIVGAGKLV